MQTKNMSALLQSRHNGFVVIVLEIVKFELYVPFVGKRTLRTKKFMHNGYVFSHFVQPQSKHMHVRTMHVQTKGVLKSDQYVRRTIHIITRFVCFKMYFVSCDSCSLYRYGNLKQKMIKEFLQVNKRSLIDKCL